MLQIQFQKLAEQTQAAACYHRESNVRGLGESREHFLPPLEPSARRRQPPPPPTYQPRSHPLWGRTSQGSSSHAGGLYSARTRAINALCYIYADNSRFFLSARMHEREANNNIITTSTWER
jgi:hypothetical protein